MLSFTRRSPGGALFPGTLLLAVLACRVMAPSAQEWENIRLNQDPTNKLQNEEQIAVNPTAPDNMVAAWRDFRLGYRRVAWGYTFDGGATWTDAGLFVEPNYPWQSDPGVTSDAQGNFYAVLLSFSSTSEENGLYVYKSTDGGVTWGPPLEGIKRTSLARDRLAGLVMIAALVGRVVRTLRVDSPADPDRLAAEARHPVGPGRRARVSSRPDAESVTDEECGGASCPPLLSPLLAGALAVPSRVRAGSTPRCAWRRS